jgi:hypothetical protein
VVAGQDVRVVTLALVRPVSALAWELRGAWATGRRVALRLERERDPVVTRVEGHVRHVSPTDAFAVVADWHVPLDLVLALAFPSRVGDSTWREGEDWAGPVPVWVRYDPRQMRLDL